MFFALFVPNIASAEIVTTTYDFKGSIDAGNTEVTMGSADADYTNCLYFTKIGNVNDPGRFAAQGDWILTEAHKQGLYSNNGGGRRFLVNNLYANDVVIFDVVDVYGTSQTISLESTSTASANGNTFTMSAKGKLVVNLTRYWNIKSITIKHDNSAVWNYDPSIETYDIYYVTTQDIQSNNLEEADFPLDYDDLPAQYLTNLQGGMALNKRIAISQVMYQGNIMTPWTLQNYGGLKSLYNWHNFAICDLKEGDRVVIQIWSGQAKFSSKAENMAYNGCSAFLDVQNNGDFDEGEDTEITCGMGLESLATYVITEDGHLDIALSGDGIFCKVYIYGDHQARMVDRYDTPINGNTSYFDTTGQLEAKHHIVPGGLHVYIGNQNDAHHAMVVSTDEGPASFVYDERHFKTPNLANNSHELSWYNTPVEGTFYRFAPDVDGTMTVRFKANSVNYRDWTGHQGNEAVDQAGTPNETNPNVSCPYYLFDGDNLWGTRDRVQTKSNGATVTFEINVVAKREDNGEQKDYYLYGWWDNNNQACGVAELIDVTFKPSKYVYPLAKWVESGATEVEAADITGYTDVCIKKKSDNIESCTAVIEDGKLKVKNITYKADTNPGGVILVKVGDRWNDGDPVFALTIAYDANFNEQVVGTDVNGNEIKRTEGYTWNFSDNSLHGLKWENRNSQEASAVDFGTHFNSFATAAKDNNGIPTNGTNNSLLTEEINKGDWSFNYRVKKSGAFYDPRFLNNYDMEGDNADMMWDTQGIIINAGSGQSCIFNEHGVSIDHSNKTQDDPDRYVGFLEGGEFIIPCLKAGDRVIVYMGSGNGSGKVAMRFNITNALDAMHNPIDPADDYYAGGSQWNVPDGHNDPYYRGCYHFYAAADGDMKFKMVGGSMCKLYSIKIYRGEREETNGVQENGKGYTIFAEKDQNGNVTTSETNSWNLHYRGKGEGVAKGEGKYNQVNEIIAHSGNITNYANDKLVRTGEQGVQYTNEGEIGMLRIRVKCMEYNQNYVTDFSDRNITLALHETKSYPYTWDFTDISGYNSSFLSAEDAIPETTVSYEEKGYDLSAWKAVGDEYAMNIYGPTTGYNNQNMIFENSKGINGNQLYAGNRVIPETQGLWFYFDNNDPAYNGSMKIGTDGLRLANTLKNVSGDGYTVATTMGWWNYKMVVPAVPNNYVVYLRMTRDSESVPDNMYSQKTNEDPVYFLQTKFNFGTDEKTQLTTDNGKAPVYNTKINEGNYAFYNIEGTDDWILAVKNTKGEASNLTFTLNGWILKKMSISEDFKSLDSNGWATESREHVIDPALTAYLTGNDIETCFVEEIDYGKVGGEGNVLLTRANLSDNSDGQIIRAAEDGDTGACILHNTANEPVKILNDGFHLFVPDMHDFVDTDFTNNDAEGIKTISTTSNGILKAQVTAGTIQATENGYTNYILSNRRYIKDQGDLVESVEAFYRVKSTGANSNGHNGYLPMETNKVTGSQANTFNVVFELDKEVDGINEVNDTKAVTTEGFYTIDGQKLNGMPTTSGLYIVNGKKVVIK